MSTIVDQIVQTKRQEVAAAQQARPVAQLQAAIAGAPRPRNFYAALAHRSPWGIHLIAEIKQASPSAGLIRADFDPVQIARTYHQAGASAVSVLTDATYFHGRLEYIGQVKEAVPLPVLRKDFIIDPYQVFESRAAGADAILLIAEILRPRELLDLLILANELQITSLIEVHEADTLLQVRSVVGFPHQRYSMLGINNRNLHTQAVDLGTTLRLKGMLDETQLLVSESGITSRQDVHRLKQAGVSAVLVGETLMRAADIAGKIAELFGPPAP